MEIWLAGSNVPGEAKNMARQAEAEGFDGVSFGDTQCISPDPFVGLTAAAAVTSTLKLCVGVTNPVTRHPAVTASQSPVFRSSPTAERSSGSAEVTLPSAS